MPSSTPRPRTSIEVAPVLADELPRTSAGRRRIPEPAGDLELGGGGDLVDDPSRARFSNPGWLLVYHWSWTTTVMLLSPRGDEPVPQRDVDRVALGARDVPAATGQQRRQRRADDARRRQEDEPQPDDRPAQPAERRHHRPTRGAVESAMRRPPGSRRGPRRASAATTGLRRAALQRPRVVLDGAVDADERVLAHRSPRAHGDHHPGRRRTEQQAGVDQLRQALLTGGEHLPAPTRASRRARPASGRRVRSRSQVASVAIASSSPARSMRPSNGSAARAVVVEPDVLGAGHVVAGDHRTAHPRGGLVEQELRDPAGRLGDVDAVDDDVAAADEVLDVVGS